jgi:uncharacterized membrane protein
MIIVKLLLSVALALAAIPAHADEGRWSRFGGFAPHVQAQGQRAAPPSRPPARHIRPAEHEPRGEQRHGGRLSDEERRALRRDIDRANREIYKSEKR